MLCEEKLEVFENGFDDGRFKLRIEFYGKDARKLLLAVIRELYVPDYGEYVYPFECAKEHWGIYLDPSEIVAEEPNLSPVKFVNRSVLNRLEKTLGDINAPEEVKGRVNLENAEIMKLGKTLIALGRDFLLDERGYLIVFNKPSARTLVLRYLGMLDET